MIWRRQWFKTFKPFKPFQPNNLGDLLSGGESGPAKPFSEKTRDCFESKCQLETLTLVLVAAGFSDGCGFAQWSKHVKALTEMTVIVSVKRGRNSGRARTRIVDLPRA